MITVFCFERNLQYWRRTRLSIYFLYLFHIKKRVMLFRYTYFITYHLSISLRILILTSCGKSSIDSIPVIFLLNKPPQVRHCQKWGNAHKYLSKKTYQHYHNSCTLSPAECPCGHQLYFYT